jgi:hypothetical protein
MDTEPRTLVDGLKTPFNVLIGNKHCVNCTLDVRLSLLSATPKASRLGDADNAQSGCPTYCN